MHKFGSVEYKKEEVKSYRGYATVGLIKEKYSLLNFLR